MAAGCKKLAVRFTEQPSIVLLSDSGADEFTFDNVDKNGLPKVSQTTAKRRKTRRGHCCPFGAEIVAHAKATDLLRGVDSKAWPEPHSIFFKGRCPIMAPPSFFGEAQEVDYSGADFAHENAHWELPMHLRTEMDYPRHSMRDLVIWTDDFVYMRVADTMHVNKLPRDEAMKLLVPIWEQYVHKGAVELAARVPPPGPAPAGGTEEAQTRRTRKRGRRKRGPEGGAGQAPASGSLRSPRGGAAGLERSRAGGGAGQAPASASLRARRKEVNKQETWRRRSWRWCKRYRPGRRRSP
jgi:hypothetical protein